jgi:hypothetical protein
MCLLMRSGIEIWVDADKADRLSEILTTASKPMLKVEGRVLNSVDIVGLFLPIDIEDLKNRKLGKWKCKHENWHTKEETCRCAQNEAMRKGIGFIEQTPEERARAREALEKLKRELPIKTF